MRPRASCLGGVSRADGARVRLRADAAVRPRQPRLRVMLHNVTRRCFLGLNITPCIPRRPRSTVTGPCPAGHYGNMLNPCATCFAAAHIVSQDGDDFWVERNGVDAGYTSKGADPVRGPVAARVNANRQHSERVDVEGRHGGRAGAERQSKVIPSSTPGDTVAGSALVPIWPSTHARRFCAQNLIAVTSCSTTVFWFAV